VHTAKKTKEMALLTFN